MSEVVSAVAVVVSPAVAVAPVVEVEVVVVVVASLREERIRLKRPRNLESRLVEVEGVTGETASGSGRFGQRAGG